MMALELVSGRQTDGAAIDAEVDLTVNTGNTFTVRNAAKDSKIYLIQAWALTQVVSRLRLRSPLMHDNVRGLSWRVDDLRPDAVIPCGAKARMYPQDAFNLQISGASVAGDVDIGAILLWYEDLPGVRARLETWEAIKDRVLSLVTVEQTLATTATGDYGGEEAINAENDLLHANTDYALLGYTTSERCGVIRWRGVDTGNLGVGGPGDNTKHELTSRWFKTLAEKTGLPCIPIFNSANKAGILVDACQDESGTDVIVASIFAELETG